MNAPPASPAALLSELIERCSTVASDVFLTLAAGLADSKRDRLRAISVVYTLQGVLLEIGRQRGTLDRAPLDARLFALSHPAYRLVWQRTADGPWVATLAREGSEPAALDGLPDDLPLDELFVRASSAAAARHFGYLFEGLLSERHRGVETAAARERKKRQGSFYTPPALTQVVIERAFGRRPPPASASASASLRPRPEPVLICDPACGGGAFLLEAAAELLRRLPQAAEPEARRAWIVENCLYGVDVDPVAVAVTEAAFWIFVDGANFPFSKAGAHLREGDALWYEPASPNAERSSRKVKLTRGAAPRHDSLAPPAASDPGSVSIGQNAAGALGAFSWRAAFPEVLGEGGFDWVLGNPPWVAYAGRAAQPLEPGRRKFFRSQYKTFAGYPTLHGMFVEQATRLAPKGGIALIVPSPIADLEGYRAVREVVLAEHSLVQPLLEFGQDAFAGVTQPCFLLLAEPGKDGSCGKAPGPWPLAERGRTNVEAALLCAPEDLHTWAAAPPLPAELFGEMGFQTNAEVSRLLLLREAGAAAQAYPLLEGRDVQEFRQGPARLFLKLDTELLKRTHCRLRPREDYGRVGWVLRQTARFPIAALHNGLPFRNSLLAGFEVAGFEPRVMVALLNSAFYRALHLARERDARQMAFPQLKIRHLRALPRPPASSELSRVAELSAIAEQQRMDPELRRRLDDAVFDVFEIEPPARARIVEFLRSSLKQLAHTGEPHYVEPNLQE